MKHEVCISGEATRDFPSFEEAFKHLYKQVCKRIEEYSISMTDVKKNCSITGPDGKKIEYLSAIEEAKAKGFFPKEKPVDSNVNPTPKKDG